MPRDAKGQLFGIESLVKTPSGAVLKVKGFATTESLLDRGDIADLARIAGESNAYYWHEVEVVDPATDPYAAYAKPDEFMEHTDHCPVDVVQREGLQLPRGASDAEVREAIDGFLLPGELADAAKRTCKVIWGTLAG